MQKHKRKQLPPIESCQTHWDLSGIEKTIQFGSRWLLVKASKILFTQYIHLLMICLFQHVPCLLEIVLNDILHCPLRTFNLNIFNSLPDFIKWFQDRTYFPSTDFCMLLEDQVSSCSYQPLRNLSFSLIYFYRACGIFLYFMFIITTLNSNTNSCIIELRYCAHIIDLFSYGNRDGKMPVSFIQKYLVKKLDLSSEAEVRSPLLSFLLSPENSGCLNFASC